MNNYIISFLILALAGCANSKNNVEFKPAPEELKKEIISTWKGILPCADCEEIHYTLSIMPDGRYDASSIYMGRPVDELKVSGTWELSVDSMLILIEKNSKSIFLFDGNELIMRDNDGKKISSTFEEMYHLRRFVSEESTALWNKKMLAGVNFSASGNEPFWSLEIKFDSTLHFKTMSGKELILPAGKSEKTTDANSTRYHSESSEGIIIVQLFKQNCIDDMSGAKKSFRVDVQVKMAGDTKYTNYKGCGKYIGDYRLHDIWALQRIGDKVIDAKEYQHGVPTIEFQLNEGKVFGFGGCNRFFGNIQMEEDKISFNQVGSTEMACPDLKLETQFLGLFADKTVPYKVTEGILYLGEGDNMLVFKKVD